MADFVLNDRVKETTTSTGTGTIQLAGAATGFDTFVAGVVMVKKHFILYLAKRAQNLK